MFKKLRADIAAAKENDPAARSKFEIWLTYSGVHALSWHRWAAFLYRHHLKLLARITSQLARRLTGIEIHPAAKIAPGVFIDHGMGVVIGETAEVGKGTVIYQGVTLGGTGKETGKRHPTVGEYCLISSGVKVLGNIYIGDYAKIGSGAVVLKDVPPHATVVGVPGKVVRIRGSKEGLDLLQETSDPVSTEVCKLRERSFALEAKLDAVTKELEEQRAAGPAAAEQDIERLEEQNLRLAQMHMEDSTRIDRLEAAVASLAKEKEQQDAVSAQQKEQLASLSMENTRLKEELRCVKAALADAEGRAMEAEASKATDASEESASVTVPVANDADASSAACATDEQIHALHEENEALREELAEYMARKAAREARREARRIRRERASAETVPAGTESAEPAETDADADSVSIPVQAGDADTEE